MSEHLEVPEACRHLAVIGNNPRRGAAPLDRQTGRPQGLFCLCTKTLVRGIDLFGRTRRTIVRVGGDGRGETVAKGLWAVTNHS
jgi:hypothetical protein